MSTGKEIELSVVATIYFGEQIVEPLIQAIRQSLTTINCTYEIILIDDRSGDNSWDAIKRQASIHHDVKGIRLSRNFGQQIAMSAGLSVAAGRYVVIMDGDLQNPPDAIPQLYQKANEGYDLVYTVSKTRNNFKDELTSSVFWFIIRRILGVNIIPNQLMMKIMSQRVVSHYTGYQEISRTVAGIVKDIGFRYAILEVENKKRHSGKSTYTFRKRFNLMVDIVINLTNTPLNFMLYFGAIVFAITLCVTAVYVVLYFVSDVPAGYTSLLLSILLFGSLIVTMLGFIGKYLSNIYTEVRRRPLFIEDEKINL